MSKRQSHGPLSFAKITQNLFFKSSPKSRSGRPRHIPLPVQMPTESPEAPEIDPFSAQLVACHEQMWWESQPASDCLLDYDDYTYCHSFDESDSSQNFDDVLSPKRSISIRSIRERMNSQQSMQSCSSTGRYEFQSGLNFLHGVPSWRGFRGWEDMETFVD